ncbi:MAG TPA: phosphoenolpyruvate carboxylase [Steroidobacteraceae bacterium]|nr:phosphoenolpyruvate carboxylase [Steroidobacteraceae bacterium]
MKRTEIHFPPQHEALREDVHALGELIGQMLSEQGGPALLATVEQDRVLAIRRREGDQSAAALLATRVRGRPPEEARDLVRAFSTWFKAVNLAEKAHRVRRRRQYFLSDNDRPQPGGIEDALRSLKAEGVTLDETLRLIGSIAIEPVFAAHPSESMRRTTLRSQQRVARLLLARLDPTLTPRETRDVWGRIRQELTAGWQTEEHPRERLTVADEREHVLYYLSEVLYRVVPELYEEIAEALAKLYDVEADAIELPPLLSFGTWVGGDMDGHPDVQGKSIRETLARQHQVILTAYHEECLALAERLAQSASRVGVSSALAKRIEEYARLLPGSRALAPSRHDRMPYRVFLAQIAMRLRHTFEGRASGYESAAALSADVRLIAESLRANKGWNAGHHSVRRLLRRIETFGFHLATLDVRQESAIHHAIVAQGLDDPAWGGRPSEERHRLLAEALERDTGPQVELDPLGKRARGVFESITQARHRYGPAAVGYYIVSGATGTDDVLAVLLLARWAEACDRRTGEVALDIAPMFDSVESLEASGAILGRLLADPLYRRHLESRGRPQCVVIGYAEGNKEAGLPASRLAAQSAQRQLAGALAALGERHVVFHARGGSVALGGGRIDAIVRAAPREAVNGVLRLTEQGEGVNQSYGLQPIALRTLERAFHALVCGPRAASPEHPAHAECAATLSRAARDTYRRLVYGDAQFFEYFRNATPIDVIERMQIGSRPAYRSLPAQLETLRPVPWTFAWTQSRLLLSAWYGAGTGLAQAIEQHGLAAVREACEGDIFLRLLIADVEAMLARADLEIAAAYDELAPAPLRRFFSDIRAEYELACERLLEVKHARRLLDADPTLQRAIDLRNPYIDPMNLMQVDLLARWRAGGREDRDLFEALLASVSGIAQGLQSTG